MTTSTSSVYFPLATEAPYRGSDGPEPDNSVDNDGGASGSSSAVALSRGALVAIIVVVVVVALVGIVSGILFYLAKKKEWRIRETIRRSARKVVTALTPHRSEFPRSVKGGHSGRVRAHLRMDEVPPTPHIPEDVEKGFKNQVSQISKEQDNIGISNSNSK